MNERTDLDRLLTSWLRSEAPATSPDALVEGALAMTARVRPLPRWRALLSVPTMRTQSRELVGSSTVRLGWAVALLLLALLVGLTAAVGSGILRLPWLQQDRPALGAACWWHAGTSPMPEGQVLVWTGEEATITLFEDGLLVTQRGYRPLDAVASIDEVRTARRLSPSGVALVRDTIEGSGLLVSGCRLDLYAEFPLRGIEVTLADGSVADTDWGRYGGFMHIATPEELQAAAELERKIQDMASWLPPDAWIDPTERSYPYDAWAVGVTVYPAYEWRQFIGYRPEEVQLPTAASFSFPGGVALLDFGMPWRQPDRTAPGPLDGRCGFVGTEEARAIAAALSDGGRLPIDDRWWFTDGTELLAVSLGPLLTPTGDCAERFLGSTAPPEPTASPAPQPTGDLGVIEPCALLSESFGSVVDEGLNGWFGRLGPDYRECTHWKGQRSLDVAVRIQRTGVSEARALAAALFGVVVEETLDGRHVWLNGCMTYQAMCSAAIAVSAEPYFVVISLGPTVEEDRAQRLRVLAGEAIANLGE